MPMMTRLAGRLAAALATAVLAASGPAVAADPVCAGLVPNGAQLVCAGFEPNWALELECRGTTLSATFVDAFSGSGIRRVPGQATVTGRGPWSVSTSHPVAGTIAYTPAGCRDESDAERDFTFTPTAAPGLSGPFYPFCCRMR